MRPSLSSRTRLARSPWVWLGVLAALLVFLEPSPVEWRVGELSVDQWVQDRFFDFTSGKWCVDDKGPVGRALFYTGPKVLLMALAVALGVCVFVPARVWAARGLGKRWFADRRTLLFLIASLALIPLVCNRIKAVSNVYCPYEHTRYGGYAPYVRVWEPYTPEFKEYQRTHRDRGRGFPAGHASGGFALMALAYAASSRRWRMAGVLTGVFAGWWMGLYQMLKGAHYLNHTLVTWCVAWLLVLLLARLFKPVGWRDEVA